MALLKASQPVQAQLPQQTDETGRVAEMLKTDLFGENGTPLPAGEKVDVPARGITTVVLRAR